MARHLNGWIMLHRRIRENWVGKDPAAFLIFVTLLLDANHEDGESPVEQGVFIKRGQVVTSDRELAERLRIPRTTVQRKLKRMSQDKTGPMLGLQAGHMRGVITIVNYDKYQSADEDGGPHSGPEVGHMRAHNEEVGGLRERNSFPTPASSLQTRARARVDPETARLLGAGLAKRAEGAIRKKLTADQARERIGPEGWAMIIACYDSWEQFREAFTIAYQGAVAPTVAVAQLRDAFAAEILMRDTETDGAQP